MPEITVAAILEAYALFDLCPLTLEVSDWGVEEIDQENQTFDVWIEFYDGGFTRYRAGYQLGEDGQIIALDEDFSDSDGEDGDGDYPDDDGDSMWDDEDALASAGHGMDESYGYFGDEW